MKTKEAPRGTDTDTKRHLRQVEISPYLWGRIGTSARVDRLTPDQVITAALIGYLDGEEAQGSYLDRIQPAAPSEPWAPFMVPVEGETEEQWAERLRKAMQARFPDTEHPPLMESLAFLCEFEKATKGKGGAAA